VTYRCLVIENEPGGDARLLGEWLTDSGLDLVVCRAHAGDPVPADLDGYAALLVLGGPYHPYAGPDGAPGASWLRDVEALLRRAVRHEVPTLAICLGAQLLAMAHAGTVERSPAGPEIGVTLVAKRDAAERDPLVGPTPMLPDVVQWHADEITELPLGAVLLFASTNYPHQAFRQGSRAWGLQFHIGADPAMVAHWAQRDPEALASAGLTAADVVAQVQQHLDDLFEVWHPVAHRFAALARGELDVVEAVPAHRELPLLGHPATDH
jgi:GMP synthase-like glutamine amidotransferase